ncbi:hypothetical protein [Streptomyces sp. SID3343]|uniref:hypothetical protein n=1 Tax=Streptomyces sp. SID3343 TaxID=2690260 RepID=UPI001371DAE5|nr:hypothetical protein [Streptomyces sp. SID3343]MYV97142.1 hypothetical protein [Streptomyces sp. SID3343]
MPKQAPAEQATDFVVTTDGVVIPVMVPRTLPPREEPHRVPVPVPIKVGDWVAPLPASGHDFVTGRVDRAEECAGLDDDQVLMVRAGGNGMPHLAKASEVYRVDPSR